MKYIVDSAFLIDYEGVVHEPLVPREGFIPGEGLNEAQKHFFAVQGIRVCLRLFMEKMEKSEEAGTVLGFETNGGQVRLTWEKGERLVILAG